MSSKRYEQNFSLSKGIKTMTVFGHLILIGIDSYHHNYCPFSPKFGFD